MTQITWFSTRPPSEVDGKPVIVLRTAKRFFCGVIVTVPRDMALVRLLAADTTATGIDLSRA